MQEDASCSETSSAQKGFCGDVEALPALLVQHCNSLSIPGYYRYYQDCDSHYVVKRRYKVLGNNLQDYNFSLINRPP